MNTESEMSECQGSTREDVVAFFGDNFLLVHRRYGCWGIRNQDLEGATPNIRRPLVRKARNEKELEWATER